MRSTVFIEACAIHRADGPAEMRPVGEVEFVQGQAAASASGLYGPSRAAAAIMGHANLTLGAAVEPVLDALQVASPNRFRGIRHSVVWDHHPEIENALAYNEPGLRVSEPFRVGARALARRGLSLDVWLNFHQWQELADLARTVPDLTIIANHVGGLLRVGPYASRTEEVLATWRSGSDAIAACPTVVEKLGGLGMPR
ncbi:MAG: amidohydrolase, partial [Dehalococcoidia bacterium]|nr:amidohydrolase [Dehalococcoidia bacterium]